MAATVANVTARPYQVVVWGATGFTGRLVAEHLARDYQVDCACGSILHPAPDLQLWQQGVPCGGVAPALCREYWVARVV